MRIFFEFFFIFGLWSSWKDNKYISQFKLYSVFSLAIVICCFSSAYFFNIFFDFNSITNTAANSLFVLIILAHLIIAIESISQKDAQMKLIEKLNFVDQMFNVKLKRIIPYKTEKFEIFVRNSIFMVLLFSIIIYFIVRTYLANHNFNFTFPSIYPSTLMRFRVLQVIYFICLLRTRLNLLNRELQDVQKIIVVKKRSKFTNRKLNNFPLSRILILKQIYGELFEICDLINEAFGWSLLAFCTQNFIDFTCNCYWGYFSMVDIDSLLVFIILLIPLVIVFGAICFYCSSCFENVNTQSYLLTNKNECFAYLTGSFSSMQTSTISN